MSALAFDTHRAVKALCEAGAAEPLAEAFVETIGDAVSGNVATKADIADVRADVDRVETTLKADIDRVETTLKADIADVKAEIAESEARVQVKIAEVQAETKADIAGVRAEVANVRAELKTEIGGLEGRLYRQLWLMAVGIAGLTVALVKLLG